MKKLLLSLILMLPGVVMAEDVVQVLPFNAPVGLTENDFDEEHVMQLYMTNTNAYTAMQLDLYLPEGLSLQLDEQAWDFNPDRFDGITRRGVFTPYHDIDISKKDDVPGHYLLLLYDTDLSVIKGNDGVLIDFYYLTSENVQPGVYPITVSGTVLTVDSHNDVRPATSVSYVKIGEPEANAVYDLGEGVVPSFVESELANTNNVVINNTCQNLILTDGNDFAAPKTFTATAASYERALAAEWGTVMLPFAVSSSDAVQYYTLSDVDLANGVLTFEETATVEANTPAVFKATGSTLSANASNVEVPVCAGVVAGDAVNGLTLTGTLSKTTLNGLDPEAATGVYYIKDNKFWRGNGMLNIPAFRAYFDAAVAGAKVLSISGDATGINSINADANAKVYTIDGKQMSNDVKSLPAGMYIVNDKKVIIKK